MRDDKPAAATRVEAIDGLRAVAALAVFVFHLSTRSPVLHDAGRLVTGHLDLGVEIFFVLSGFLIFGPFAKALLHDDDRPAPLAYVAKRAARIWPAYLVVLLTIIVAGTATLDGVRGFLKHATLTYLYFDDQGGDGLTPAWTLVVEMSFYAFVPIAAFVIARTGRRVMGATVACIAVGAIMQHHVAYDLETDAWVRILPPRLLMLGIGMLLAAVYHQGDAVTRLGRGLRAGAARPAVLLSIAAAGYAALILLVPSFHEPVTPAQRFSKEVAQGLIAGCIALPVLLPAAEGGRWGRLLAHRGTAYLGAISYGIYLWHIPMLRLLRAQIVSENVLVVAAGGTAALVGTLGLAALSWHLVERPLMETVARRLRARDGTTQRKVTASAG